MFLMDNLITKRYDTPTHNNYDNIINIAQKQPVLI